MQTNPLVELTMSVSTVVQGVSRPGQKVPTREAVTLEVPPAAPGQPPSGSVANGTLNLSIIDPTMIAQLKLGESYRVLIFRVDSKG